MYAAFPLLILVGISFLIPLLDCRPHCEAFLKGVVLENNEFFRGLESVIEPLKRLLLRLFFIIVGDGLNAALVLKKTPLAS